MHFKKPVLFVVAFAALAHAPVAWAQKPAKTAPKPPHAKTAPAAANLSKAEVILDKYVEATGGKAAYEKITSTSTKAAMTMTAQGLSGTMEGYAKAPNKIYVVQNFSGIGKVEQGYDGITGWSKDPLSGLRTLDGTELAQLQSEALFNSPLRWRETARKTEMLGVKPVADKPAYVIRLTDKRTGKTRTEYYDTRTGLQVKSESTQESPQGIFPVETYYSDYRTVDGVKFPFKVRGIFAGQEITTTITEVKNNVPIDDARFTKPTGDAAPAAPVAPAAPATP